MLVARRESAAAERSSPLVDLNIPGGVTPVPAGRGGGFEKKKWSLAPPWSEASHKVSTGLARARRTLRISDVRMLTASEPLAGANLRTSPSNESVPSNAVGSPSRTSHTTVGSGGTEPILAHGR